MTTVQELLDAIIDNDADGLNFEIYSVTGQKYLVRAAYIEDDFFCLDIEPDPDSI